MVSTVEPNPTVLFVSAGQVEVRSTARPSPGADQVLVRTRRSLISIGTELTLLGAAGVGQAWTAISQFPRQSGYSNVGVVEAVGAGVDRAWIGRRVHNHGPHQAWALAPASKLVEVPSAVSDEAASFATLAKVALNGLRRGGLCFGEAVLVSGLGIVGQITARACVLAGARPVFVVEPAAARRALLLQAGAGRGAGPFEVLPFDQPARWPELIRAANHGRLVDLALELSGHAEALASLPDCVRDLGRLVIVSSPRGSCTFDFHDHCNRRSLAILGAHSAHHPLVEHPATPWTSARHAELFLDWIARGELDAKAMITHRFSADHAAQAYALLGERRTDALGVVLDWSIAR